jgi:hypothetical protein
MWFLGLISSQIMTKGANDAGKHKKGRPKFNFPFPPFSSHIFLFPCQRINENDVLATHFFALLTNSSPFSAILFYLCKLPNLFTLFFPL